jgi:hypothetical protein
VNLRNYKEYIFSITKVTAHKFKKTSVGFGTHIATNRSSFTLVETDCTSNATLVGEKACISPSSHSRGAVDQFEINFEAKLL